MRRRYHLSLLSRLLACFVTTTRMALLSSSLLHVSLLYQVTKVRSLSGWMSLSSVRMTRKFCTSAGTSLSAFRMVDHPFHHHHPRVRVPAYVHHHHSCTSIHQTSTTAKQIHSSSSVVRMCASLVGADVVVRNEHDNDDDKTTIVSTTTGKASIRRYDDNTTTIASDVEVDDDHLRLPLPPWNAPSVPQRVATKRRNNNARFRQHVNPLSSSYQRPTLLDTDWPNHSVYNDVSLPLHLDIGCGKGGFLIDLCRSRRMQEQQQQQQQYESGDIMDTTSPTSDDAEQQTQPLLPNCNYLGLEIRPGVAAYAKERIATHSLQGQLDFIGCNANVDLDRILSYYQDKYIQLQQQHHHQHDNNNNNNSNNSNEPSLAATVSSPLPLCLQYVTIQFPDPHFKAQHAKRRVVTSNLIHTLAKYMPPNAIVYLQSDIQFVLDDMRIRFRTCHEYFEDTVEDLNNYDVTNPWNVPTEREESVLVQGLPVYRSLFVRNDATV